MNPPSRQFGHGHSGQVPWQNQTCNALFKRLGESGINYSKKAPKVLLVEKVLKGEWEQREASKKLLNDANDPNGVQRKLRAKADEEYIIEHLDIAAQARIYHYERLKKSCTGHTSTQKAKVRSIFAIYRDGLDKHRIQPDVEPKPVHPNASIFYIFNPLSDDTDHTSSKRKKTGGTSSKATQTVVAGPDSQVNILNNKAPVHNPVPKRVLDKPTVAMNPNSVYFDEQTGRYCLNFVDLENGDETEDDDEGEFHRASDDEIGSGHAIHDAPSMNGQQGIGIESPPAVEHDAYHNCAIPDDSDDDVEPPSKKRRTHRTTNNNALPPPAPARQETPVPVNHMPPPSQVTHLGVLGPYDDLEYEKDYKNKNPGEDQRPMRMVTWGTNPGRYYLFLDKQYHRVRGHRVALIHKWLEEHNSPRPKRIYVTPMGYYFLFNRSYECEKVAGDLLVDLKHKFDHPKPKLDIRGDFNFTSSSGFD